MVRTLILLVCALGLACATAPPVSSPDESAAWGYLKLIRHEGVSPGGSGAGYGDRRLGGVELVDYSRPGFAVVYVDTPVDTPVDSPEPAPSEPVVVSIQKSGVGPRFLPRHAVARVGGTIRVRNIGEDTRVLSCPAAGLIRSLEPGESFDFALAKSQAYELFLLDVPSAVSTVFAAPGRFARVSDSGRFELVHLSPGTTRIAAWHPRFPPVSRLIDLKAGEAFRIDLNLGVGQTKENDDASN